MSSMPAAANRLRPTVSQSGFGSHSSMMIAPVLASVLVGGQPSDTGVGVCRPVVQPVLVEAMAQLECEPDCHAVE